MTTNFLDGRVIVAVGDITEQDTHAIVNAANSTLLGGGGVDDAIHGKGGRAIYDECLKIRQTVYPGGLPTGKAVITPGGDLKARFVIHTVGPVYGMNGGRDAELLADCYFNSLALAAEKNLRSVAFPSISTGAFHYPKHEAARISSRAINDFLDLDDIVSEVRLVFFSESDARMFLKHQNFIAGPKTA
ncbi:MAG: macro domain-containing protein [Acidobacteria bacterium]|nr:macro domain-containing protein [Acidobacteriota bacterium]